MTAAPSITALTQGNPGLGIVAVENYGTAPIFATCDWDDCDEPTVALRLYLCRWLCVCRMHADEPGAITRNIDWEAL